MARELLAAGEERSLTMRGLGAAAGIRAPSLYKHFRDKGELEACLAREGWAELAELARAWSAERGADLARVESGYHRFATENGALYRLMARALTAPEAASLTGALTAVTGSPAAARSAFAALHGGALLELAGA